MEVKKYSPPGSGVEEELGEIMMINTIRKGQTDPSSHLAWVLGFKRVRGVLGMLWVGSECWGSGMVGC